MAKDESNIDVQLPLTEPVLYAAVVNPIVYPAAADLSRELSTPREIERLANFADQQTQQSREGRVPSSQLNPCWEESLIDVTVKTSTGSKRHEGSEAKPSASEVDPRTFEDF